jgi:uncharacterized phage-associated protein
LKWKTEEMASYIVNYHKIKVKMLTQQKLQKFLYLIDKSEIEKNNKSAYLNEKVEFWQLGAVYPKVYSLYKVTAGGPIHSPARYVGFDYSLYRIAWIDIPEPDLTKEEKMMTNSILDKYIDLDQFAFIDEVFALDKNE